MSETLKLVFADREAYYGDPDFVNVPDELLLSDAYARERRGSIRTDRAWPAMPEPFRRTLNRSPAVAQSLVQDGPFDTSFVGVVDSWGNANFDQPQRCIERYDRYSGDRLGSVLAGFPVVG